MDRCTTRDEFCQLVGGLAETLAQEIWTTVVDTTSEGADTWLRARGGAWLRRVLGEALTARAERLGMPGTCGACGGVRSFRQHRPMRVHTVIPGREVETRLVYGQCVQCQAGVRPLVQELGTDAEGFTPALQQMATVAGVIEPYEAASTELLGRLAGVAVSREKIHALVHAEGRRALAAPPVPAAPAPPSVAPLTVAIDGGMIFVDGRWQEVKIGCVYDTADRVVTPTRSTVTARQVVAVRGTPAALAAQLWPRADAWGAAQRRVVVLGDGAPWIWNVAAE